MLLALESVDWVGLDLATRSYSHKRDAYAGRKRRWWQFPAHNASSPS